MNLLSPFFTHALNNPEDLALYISGEEYSYGQLLDKVRSLAGWIDAVTHQPNPRVGILAGRDLTSYVGILAATFAGAAYVPLNFKAPQDYLSDILREAKLDALVIDRVGLKIIEKTEMAGLPKSIVIPFETMPNEKVFRCFKLQTLASSQILENPRNVSAQDCSYLMFTSGTTGKPKGILISVQNISHLLTVLQKRYQYSSKDRLSQAFELTFDLSVFDIFMALRSGASLHVVPDHQMPMPAHFIQQQLLTSWFSVPSMIGVLKQMRLLRPNVFPSLRLSLFCGEALPEESVRTWQEAAPNSRLENLYGPTEATVACLLQDCSDPHAITPDRGIMAIGWPFEGLKADVVSPNGDFLEACVHGELAVHGPQVALGYLNNPALTEKRFPVLDHPQWGQTRWYLTGDLAYRDTEDRYHFLGRVDNQVQLRGYRIELDEIEYHLRMISGCDNAVAVFLEDSHLWAQEIVGIIASTALSTAEIRRQLARRLPPYMVPQRIVVRDNLPTNASGKIDRNTLKKELLNNKKITS